MDFVAHLNIIKIDYPLIPNLRVHTNFQETVIRAFFQSFSFIFKDSFTIQINIEKT